MSEPIHYETAGRVATITLNRPEKRNALSAELISAITDNLERAVRDNAVGAIVLTGAGDKAFCAGGDLSSQAGEGLLGMHQARRGFADLLLRLAQLEKPIVGAANGHALGGGFGLLLACDLVVVRRDARYGTPEVKRGLFPMMIASVLLRTLGRRRTLELALTGREVSGETLLGWGAVNAVVEAADVVPQAQMLAAEMAELSPAVLALGRRAVFAAEDMTMPQQLDYLHTQLTLNTLAEDAAEGLAAFFEKRPPAWKGR